MSTTVGQHSLVHHPHLPLPLPTPSLPPPYNLLQHYATYQSLLQLQTEEHSVSNLFENLKHVCLQVTICNYWCQLCLVEPQHSF